MADQTSSKPLTADEAATLMEEVRLVASRLLARESIRHSIATTDLMQTAFRRQSTHGRAFTEVTWRNRSFFFGAMYRAMLCALIDRSRKRSRRVLTIQVEHLDEVFPDGRRAGESEIWQALAELGERAPELATLVQHRVFGNFTLAEIARLVGLSERTVRNRLAQAYGHLRVQLGVAMSTRKGPS